MWAFHDNLASSMIPRCLKELSLSKCPWQKGLLAAIGLKDHMGEMCQFAFVGCYITVVMVDSYIIGE